MGYSYRKRLTLLKEQTDEALDGRLGLFRTTFLFVLGLSIISFLIPNIIGGDIQPTSPDKELTWQESLQQGFDHRLVWLRESPLSISPGASSLYSGWGQGVVSFLGIQNPKKSAKAAEDESLLDSLFSWKDHLKRRFASALLRGGFVLIGFWPIWALGFFGGLFGLRRTFRSKRTEDFLGVCDRGRTPFYSGIYGPLITNHNLSGIDHSAPGLACPTLVPESEAQGHRLTQILDHFRAKNGTNFDLVRVILQYRDFPCLVETEMSSTQEPEAIDAIERPLVSSIVPFLTNAGGTIEKSALDGLPAVMEAHRILAEYIKVLDERKIAISELNGNYGKHLELLGSIAKPSSTLARILIFSLTPNRAYAIGRLPAHIIATCYLSTEAGKCLVFRRQEGGFSKISHYPHLQARAILQSLVSYHNEHKGEARLLIRQAIISSRRHGDFGRAFLPVRMSVESRALRDWLEILYSDPSKRESTAELVELDAHVEEISINWKLGYARRIRTWQDQEQGGVPPTGSNLAGPPYPFWKGMVYKSVILMPISDLVSLALRGIDEARINRMEELIRLTRRVQHNLSVMARLPGFKRLALENSQGTGEANPFFTNGRQELLKRWTVVRRVLQHYNWLSTRVGDYSVPFDGLIHCIVKFPDDVPAQQRLFPFEAMVPFRQRRCEEIFGRQWEQHYYFDSPHPAFIEVFNERHKYLESLASRGAGGFKFSATPIDKTDGNKSTTEKNGEPAPKGPAVASG